MSLPLEEIWTDLILPGLCSLLALGESRLGDDGRFEYDGSLKLMVACRVLRTAVLKRNDALAVDCLKNSPSFIQETLQKPGASHFKLLRLRLQRSHCKFCEEIFKKEPWPFTQLNFPRSIAFQCKVPLEPGLVLRNADPWPGVRVLDYTGTPPERTIDRVLGRGLRADVDDTFVTEQLSILQGLQRLSLRRCDVRSLMASANVGPHRFPQLQSLDLSHCSQLTDLGVGSICEQLCELQQLGVSFCSRLRCPRPFGGPKLRHLEATGCACLTDAAIENLHAPLLESLNVSECTGLRQAALVNCPEIRSLNFSFCSRLVDEALQRTTTHCPKLEELRLNYSRIAWPVAKPMPALRRLALRGTRVEFESLNILFHPRQPRTEGPWTGWMGLDLAGSQQTIGPVLLEVVDVRDCVHLQQLPAELLSAAHAGHCTIYAGGSPAETAFLASLADRETTVADQLVEATLEDVQGADTP